MPSQVLVNVLTINNLGAGAFTTIAHGLKVANAGVTPTLAFPDRGTNIRVSAANDTTITFENVGATAEVLVKFRVEYGLSNEVDNTLLPSMLYEGGSAGGGGGGGGGLPGGGGYLYYLNASAADLPEPTAGSRELSLTYTGTVATLGPTIPADFPLFTTLEQWVTDIGDPGATSIPPGIWSLSLQSRASHTDGIEFGFKVSKWDGATLTDIAQSDFEQISNVAGYALNTAEVFVPFTTLTASDRLVITVEATKIVPANRTIEVSLGGTSPSHLHTTFGSPGGTGLVKVVNGVVQDPATLLVDADVDAAANIAVSKLAPGAANRLLRSDGTTNSFQQANLATDVTGTLPVTNGGTGITSGTGGGVPYFNTATTMAASAALAANEIVLGGGPGVAPATLGSKGTTSTVLHGNAAGAPSFGAVALGSDVSGTLPVGNGGLGTASTPTNGQIPIGNGTGYTLATITAGSGVTVTNGAGSITIAATGGAGGGASSGTLRVVTTTDSWGVSDYTLLVQPATATSFTLTLLSAVTAGSGRMFVLKHSGTGTITVASGGGTIDGAATLSVSTQYAAYTFISDGTNWHII